MNVVPGMLDGLIAYIDGLNLAAGCLDGFREWLMARFEDGDNFYWGGLFQILVRNDSATDDEAITKLG